MLFGCGFANTVVEVDKVEEVVGMSGDGAVDVVTRGGIGRRGASGVAEMEGREVAIIAAGGGGMMAGVEL